MFGEIERNYDFRKVLLQANERGVCDKSVRAGTDELSLVNGVFFTGEDSTEIAVAKADFIEFLSVSCGVERPYNEAGVEISLSLGGDLKEVNAYKGRRIIVSENKIQIHGFDYRGLACALFDIEEILKGRKTVNLPKKEFQNKPLFSPRMAHSGYGLDEFPEKYMLRLLKEGIDTIILFMKEPNANAFGEKTDINGLIAQANAMGLDVYAYCKLQNFHHPDEENAEETFDKVYGDFFRIHNGFKGLILVGESVEFPSKDERVACRYYYEVGEDGIPDGKLSPGWFPCRDYPQWLELIKKSIRKAKPDADIVFWTYNWGWAGEKERVELLNALPTDVSLLVTFEMFQKFKYGKVSEMVCDYSLVQATAGDYFLSEAKVAKERNIRLYTQANAGGRTWDFGILPYEPMPYHWKKRYDSMNECREKYNLQGVMECHHFGFTPSFITSFEKRCFEYAGDFSGGKDSTKYLNAVLRQYFGENLPKLKEGFALMSKALDCYPPTDEMQYGPMRIGTAYPLNLIRDCKQKKQPYEYFGMKICETTYRGMDSIRTKFTPHCVRVRVEIKRLKRGVKYIKKAIKCFKRIGQPNEKLLRQINMIEYILCCYKTAVHVKEFYLQKCAFNNASTCCKATRALDNIERIARAEIENAKESIAFVEKDSAIGYEASMCYQGDKAHIEWKIKQVEYMLKHEVGMYRNCLEK
ncbi:MAG: hypothetical protein IJ506_02040 [Clostridia bacterium]|nr:hypothetical protein [Clostridia bacterium]